MSSAAAWSARDDTVRKRGESPACSVAQSSDTSSLRCVRTEGPPAPNNGPTPCGMRRGELRSRDGLVSRYGRAVGLYGTQQDIGGLSGRAREVADPRGAANNGLGPAAELPAVNLDVGVTARGQHGTCRVCVRRPGSTRPSLAMLPRRRTAVARKRSARRVGTARRGFGSRLARAKADHQIPSAVGWSPWKLPHGPVLARYATDGAGHPRYTPAWLFGSRLLPTFPHPGHWPDRCRK